MDYVQIFSDELQSVLRTKPSISKAKMVQITRAAIKGIRFYKHIVQTVEKFISRCRPEYMISGVYIIDSIVRQSRHQFGHDRDVYTARFSKNICITFETLLNSCLPEDRPKIIRVLNLWRKNGVFDLNVLQPLMELTESTMSFPKSPDKLSPNQAHSSTRYPTQNFSDSSLKFNREILDFDYGEDDDEGDETPTEAEPPLSSTLSKIKNMSFQLSSPHTDKSYTKHFEQKSIFDRKHHATVKESNLGDKNEPSSTDKRRSRSRSPPSQRMNKSADIDQAKLTSDIDIREQELIQNSATRQAEREAEREKKCLPAIRDKFLTVCSSTLWLGHLPRSVSEVDISDAFGEYGTISSIDLVPPRGCAYVCMDRRQDAKRALDESKNLKLKHSHIKMAWAPGKGFKEYKKLKDFWEADVGASFIPYSKVDQNIDFDVLEEGGLIDEDSMSMEMCERRELRANEKKVGKKMLPQSNLGLPLLSQPAMQPFGLPPPNLSVPPPSRLGQGLIPFPPPSSAASAGSHTALPSTSSFMMCQNVNTSLSSGYRDTLELENPADPKSPQSIDQQLSMTERQISMVEQQLSMIQQAQGINCGPPIQALAPMPHPQIYPQQPMMFDIAMNQHMLHSTQSGFLDASLPMFANHQLNQVSHATMMMPTSLAGNPGLLGMNESFDEQRTNY